MDGEAVKELVKAFREPMAFGDLIARPNDWTISDQRALTKAPTAETLLVATLGAVRDYIAANRDALALDHVVVHVKSPAEVQVSGPLSAERVRETFLAAKAADFTDGFLGKFHSLEDFIIGLQVRFIAGDDRQRLLTLLSNVKHETVKSALDDGMTQIVQARAGVALVSDVAVPNPVTLTAFRTFRDIPQPSSIYVVRVSGQSGGLPQVGLFEADGGVWKLTAVERIKDWLTQNLPDTVAVLA